jgi:hypothetical protein
MRLPAAAILLFLLPGTSSGQARGKLLSFEVASLKPASAPSRL